MKVLFLLHTAAPSGAELATARLAGALQAIGVDVAATFTEDGPMVDRMRKGGIKTTVMHGTFDSRALTIDRRSARRLLVGLVGLVRLGWSLGAHARRAGASVIVAESTKALVMGAVAAQRARVPLIWQVHDRISVEYFGAALAAIIRGLGWVVSDGYLANSRSTCNTLITWRKRFLVAYPGIEVDSSGQRRAQRSPAETVVAVVGRLTRWKGQDVFLRALADVAIPPAQVYLVGGTHFDEQPYRDELRSLAARFELPVKLTDHVDDPEPYMRDADVLVHCSVIAEPFGQVVVEGMNAGCAVIAARPGGPTEIIESGVNGLLVDAGDREQLTAALDRLIGNQELRQQLSTAGQARAAKFDIVDSARKVAAFLKTVVAQEQEKSNAHA
jgi:glycosyltransferase involved in cell wall biosynthesis